MQTNYLIGLISLVAFVIVFIIKCRNDKKHNDTLIVKSSSDEPIPRRNSKW